MMAQLLFQEDCITPECSEHEEHKEHKEQGDKACQFNLPRQVAMRCPTLHSHHCI